MTTRRRWVFVALALIVATLAGISVYQLTRGQDDQCGRPVAERDGGWFCYEPDPSERQPAPDGY